MLTDHAWHEIARALDITQRELQIVQAVFDNQHEGDIARHFQLSPHTVHMHMNRLFKKLNITSRTELVLRIVEQMVALTLSETAVLPPICPRHHTSACCLHHNQPAPPAKPKPCTVLSVTAVNWPVLQGLSAFQLSSFCFESSQIASGAATGPDFQNVSMSVFQLFLQFLV